VLGEEFVQFRDPLHALREPRRSEFPACLVLDFDVMMVFGRSSLISSNFSSLYGTLLPAARGRWRAA
jgi:hypothetical protein